MGSTVEIQAKSSRQIVSSSLEKTMTQMTFEQMVSTYMAQGYDRQRAEAMARMSLRGERVY
jgi:hypothetical protein